jgi:hypothetical protein
MSSRSSSSSSGMSCGGFFVALLTVAFVVLKLTGYIEWTWLWVLSPLWIYTAFLVLVILVVLGIAAIVYLKDK